MTEFNPEDPTVPIWKRLLRRYPGKGTYKKRSKKERRDMSIKIQNYYVDNKHPKTSEH